MTGLLLINLGTPDAPDPASVRRYLRQFLSDERVIDIHPVLRALLLHLIILPLRPRRSAEAYRKVWDERGSPLLYHSQDLLNEVRRRLPGWPVELGMRYGRPSIESALEALLAQGAARVIALPLYPQYSSASTGSSVEEVFRVAAGKWVVPPISVVDPFPDDPGFISAFAEQGRRVLAEFPADHVLFSFHGIPERHVIKGDETGARCLKRPDCCDRLDADGGNRLCYRAGCYATARALARALDLPQGTHSVSFQSRLGRTPWLRPYTDVVLPELAQAGKRRVVVFCPAFVADCLETVEEIGMRGRDAFRAAGGEDLRLVPSLNGTGPWADAVVGLVRAHARRLDRCDP